MASSGREDENAATAREKYREGCVRAAIGAGLINGGYGVLAGTALTLALNAAWRPFRFFSASVQTAIVRSFRIKRYS
jgi:hypothetical protein